MTDISEDNAFSTTHLVDIQALVMVRDDSTGGWVPMGGGGLSHVSILKCAIPGESGQVKYEYFIFGKRLSDDFVILQCVVKNDLEYNRVMPTFHHWQTRYGRFGLTFQTAADARAFDKGLRIAVGTDRPKSRRRRKRGTELDEDDDDDDDDETLEFAVTDVDSQSTSDSSLPSSPQITPQELVAQMSHLLNPRSEPGSPTQSDHHSYLQLSGGQEYVYPDAEGTKLVQQDSSGSLKIKGTETAPQNVAKPSKKDTKKAVRNRCRYCHEIYSQENNRRGACEYAPDCFRTTIDEVACIRAARCMMYHCMADEEGEFAQHPCECTNEDGSRVRWTGLAFLSIFFPCLCLYPPLRGCYWLCVQCGLCGGRHRPAS